MLVKLTVVVLGIILNIAASHLLHIFWDSHYLKYDTLPLIDDLQTPAYKWNQWRSDSFVIPEPITEAFPKFGVPGFKNGGARQSITNTKIKEFTLKELSND